MSKGKHRDWEELPLWSEPEPAGGVVDAPADDDLPPSTWKEVPQEVFLSWPDRKQLLYCAARDEDAALHAATLTEALWFQERATRYKEMADA